MNLSWMLFNQVYCWSRHNENLKNDSVDAGEKHEKFEPE